MDKQAIYLTDDRDLPEEDQRALVIFPGENGDWYVQVTPPHGRSTEGVRICTSGGASRACPGLVLAVADAYRAMKEATDGERPSVQPTRADMEAELEAWRAAYPSRHHLFGSIVDKMDPDQQELGDDIRRLPAQTPRVENGALQFGDDWPGVFVRGDSAGYYAMTLHALLELTSDNGSGAEALARLQLQGLCQLLRGAIVGPAGIASPAWTETLSA